MSKKPHTIIKGAVKFFTCISIALVTTITVAAQDIGWPRQITAPKGVITIFQPQLDSFTNNVIEARAAVSVTPQGYEPTCLWGHLAQSPRLHRS